MDQVTPPIVIELDYTLDTKGIHGHVCISQSGDFVTLKDASASVEYNQQLNLSVEEQVRIL